MKNLLLLLVLSLVGCTTAPTPKPPVDCGSLASASTAELHIGGLPPEMTVQAAVQSPLLIGGKPADGALWPASVYARSGNSSCSATLVGDRVLFMAAHCMPNGGKVSFSAHANQYTARCAHHPEYKNNDTADWALCLVDRPVTSVPFEVLGTEENLALGLEVLLSGYGCVNKGGGGGNDGIFRIGNASIRGLPGGKSYDIVTKGGAALCFGDSGGAAYIVHDEKTRHIIGVNSRGDIATMSYLPSVAQATFVNWAKSWASSSNNVRICGVHSDALGCRGDVTDPTPDGKFELSTKAACIKGAVKPDYLGREREIVDSVREALEKF